MDDETAAPQAAPPDTPPATPPGDTPHRRGEPGDFLAGVGARLRTARAQRGMTRRALARHAGVSERYIAQAEGGAGNLSILVLRAVAGALGVGLAALLEDEREYSPEARRLAAIAAGLTPWEISEAAHILATRFAPPPEMRKIALIGLRGAGKSTLGALLARKLNVRFIELDSQIEKQAGIDLAAIFELHGRRAYHRLERMALKYLLESREICVIAAGGSIVADAPTFEMLLRGCRTVWLRAQPEDHMQRVIAQGDLRPMQDNRQAMADLRAILEAREKLYARANHTLDTSGRDIPACLEALAALVA
jgi:XRE family aerobic/anaerobic benzoate catabolism transcriptional regulator